VNDYSRGDLGELYEEALGYGVSLANRPAVSRRPRARYRATRHCQSTSRFRVKILNTR